MRTKIILLLLMISSVMYSQSESEGIGLIAKPYGDSIVLRLITTDYMYLEEIITSGYEVNRQEIDIENLKKIGAPVVLSTNGNVKIGSQISLDGVRSSEYYEMLKQIESNFSGDMKFESNSHKQMFQQSLELASNVIGATDVNASKYLGLRFTDERVVLGKSYVYYITMNHPREDRSINLRTVVPSNIMIDPPRPILYDLESDFEKITLKWERTINNQNYFVYDIERSADGKQFEVINDMPILNMFDQSMELDHAYYVDSVENYIPYTYRLVGWTYFADQGSPSKEGKGMGIDNIPPNKPNIGYLNLVDEPGVVVQWSVQDPTQEVDAYEVLKSHDLNKGFTKINQNKIDKGTFEFIDRESIKEYKNYYKVCAVDTAGNRACSGAKRLLVQDMIAPATPLGVTSEIDTNGVVTLSWQPNLEEDLWGYYVYRTNDKQTNFLRVTNHPFLGTSFRDTVSIKTLTKSLYYAVAAIDVRANVSVFSDTIDLKRPDKIAPSPALFISGVHTEKGNELKWNPSPFMDVESQVLHRAVSKTNEWEVIKTLQPFVNTYIDTSSNSLIYKYKLLTIDDSGNEAISANVLTVKRNLNKKKKELPNVTIAQTENTIKIDWKFNAATDKLVVFKSESKGSTMKRYQIIDCDSCTFWEEEINDSEAPIYKIKLRTTDGRYTASSDLLTLNK